VTFYCWPDAPMPRVYSAIRREQSRALSGRKALH
jgi:hypothetical protein